MRRNRGEGTESTSVVLAGRGSVDWVEEWGGRTVEVAAGDGGRLVIPAPKGRWLAQTKRWWEALWLAPEAQMVRPHHLPALERLYGLYDEEERLRRRVAGSRVVARAVPVAMDGVAEDGEQVVEHDVRAERVPGHLGVGSQGQLVRSPDWDALMRTRQEIRALEDRFAGTPMAQFRAGWQQAAMVNEQARAREAAEIGEVAARLAAQHEQIEAGGGS